MSELGPPDVWLVRTHELPEKAIRSLRGLLSPDELRDELNYKLEEHRRSHVVAKSLVRTVLGTQLGANPRELRFSSNGFGRPELSAVDGGHPPVSFNLSYGAGVVVLGVARGRYIGVDVENVQGRMAPLEVAHRFFSMREVQDLNGCDPPDQHLRFFQYWTLKEAYIKARGLGLRIPLGKFGFTIQTNDQPPQLWADNEIDRTPERWAFWSLRYAELQLALCIERSGDAMECGPTVQELACADLAAEADAVVRQM